MDTSAYREALAPHIPAEVPEFTVTMSRRRSLAVTIGDGGRLGFKVPNGMTPARLAERAPALITKSLPDIRHMRERGETRTAELPAIAVIAREPQAADGHTRYRLTNGWFIDREERTHRRHYAPHKYTAWEPGAGESGGAAARGTASSLAGLLDQLNQQRRAAVRTIAATTPASAWAVTAAALGGL